MNNPVSASLIETEHQKLTASDAEQHDTFGQEIAISENTALISSNTKPNRSVYVFKRLKYDNYWTEIQKLTITGGIISGGQKGLSINGDTAVISASEPYTDNIYGNRRRGIAYVFVRNSDGEWVEHQKLNPQKVVFDHNTEVSVDGDIILISRYWSGGSSFSPSSSVSVFERDSNGMWTEKQELSPSGSTNDDYSASVSGNTAIIGSYLDNSAYIFVRDRDGHWSEQAKLTASDSDDNPYHRFGSDVSLSGNTALIGVDASFSSSPAAYVFVRDEFGNWTEQTKLTAKDTNTGRETDESYFASNISLNGNMALINQRTHDKRSAHLFVRDKNNVWSEQKELSPSDEDSLGIAFGFTTVSLSKDTALVSAIFNHGYEPTDAGAVYLYILDSDGDTVNNYEDNCPLVSNLDQANSDPDTEGDACDIDDDNDGLSDEEELHIGTDPLNPDTDDDGLSDGAEVNLAAGGNCPSPLESDSDNDSLKDGEEVEIGTDPCNPDTDNDGIPDGDEEEQGTDPLDPDSDDDGIPDGSDPDVLIDFINGLPVGFFKNNGDPKGQRHAFLSQLNNIEIDILNGDIENATQSLQSLRKKVDGCGESSDNNDWINDCASQLQVRNLIDLLIANLNA